jgi:hypothetical protein
VPRAAATLEARVAALERLVRALAPAVAPQPAPARLSKRAAAAVLCCSVPTVERYAARGLLVPLPKPAGAPACARTYYDRANVLALVDGEESARAWVARRKFVRHDRRA